ncbi:MAG: WHG domain-containing protein, partial [Gemmatimonadaceae bacterium]
METRGAGHVTLRRLGAAVGKAHTAAFMHFAAISEVLEEVAAQGWEELHDRLEQLPVTETTAAARQLIGLAEAYTRFALDHPMLFRLMYDADMWGVIGRESRDALARVEGFRNACFHSFVRAIADGQKKGEVREGDPSQLAR